MTTTAAPARPSFLVAPIALAILVVVALLVGLRLSSRSDERAFAQVEVGMTSAEVVDLMGEPNESSGWTDTVERDGVTVETGRETLTYHSRGRGPTEATYVVDLVDGRVAQRARR